MSNYYYAVYPRYLPPNANIQFNQHTTSTTSSTGYLQLLGNTQQVGLGISGNLQYVAAGASVEFSYGGANSYASVASTVSNGDFNTPSLVRFATVVPTGATVTSIIPPYKNKLTNTVITQMVTYITNNVNFGLYYDQVNQIWSLITPSSIGTSTNWLIKFTFNQGAYNVSYKTMNYTFGSAGETNFYFDPTVRVYDSMTGSTITDSIKILKINTLPNTATPIGTDIVWSIYNTITAPDGYTDDTQVKVTFPSTQIIGIPDNPDLFTRLVGNVPAAGTSLSANNLYFQYKHNTPARNRIDPTPVNIIDMYILTAAYTSNYMAWLQDLTGTVKEPLPPTASSLEVAYNSLDNSKTISDSIVYNPAQFKPLFGAKADPSLQATFQVVINPAVNITANEMKTQVIDAINNYFDISNWDFGDTFYFSELAAYLHSVLAPNLASIVIVPSSTDLIFGNYFQINSEPWEILTNAATVNDVQIVSSLTAAQLGISGVNFGSTQ